MVEDVITDSRHGCATQNALFVAMVGRNHDSHDFVWAMQHRGVESFMVEREIVGSTKASFVVVKNSLAALQRLAAHHRSTFSGKVVAIIGSNGKTTIKEWAQQSYSGSGELYCSPRSYNSQLGVALSLLYCSGAEQIILLEAGVSQKGEMERLELMIRPDVVVVSSIGDAHQEGFDSLEQKIEQKMIMARRAKKVIYHSHYAPLVEYFEQYKGDYTLLDAAEAKGGNLGDPHSRYNSQIVEALLRECGCTTFSLDSLTPLAMRLEIKEGLGDSIIINDSYNSCVNSLSIALNALNAAATGRKTTLILSPILQSGVSEEELYGRVAKVIEAAKIDRVIGVGGALDRWLDCDYFGSIEELLSKISHSDYAGRAVLLKGNHTSHFERLSHHLERHSHTTRLEVDLDAMIANLNYYRSLIKSPTKLVAMVKASSYGAGDGEIAQVLESQGVDYLAVAFVDEGVILRQKGIAMPVIVLNADDDSFEPMIQNHLEPEIYSLRSLRLFVEALERSGEKHYPIHLKIDSGMHRLGFEAAQIEELIAALREPKVAQRVRVASIFSHLSTADDPLCDEFTLSQIELFDTLSSQISKGVGYRPMRHIANSAAIERFPQAHFDGCRLGIGLYGFGSTKTTLTPISTLKSRIVQIKEYDDSTSIGYGRAQSVGGASRVATLPIGYADGLRRSLSCGGWSMRVCGKDAPIVGRICMDSVMIDVSGIAEAKEGSTVTIFSAEEGNTAADMAKILGTIPYEILTSLSTRVKRVYLKE